MVGLLLTFLLLPVIALFDWLGFVGRQQPGLPQGLALISHGVGVIAVPFAVLRLTGVNVPLIACILWGGSLDVSRAAQEQAAGLIWLALFGFGVAGIFVGFKLVRVPHIDPVLMGRAILKTGLGVVGGVALWNAVMPPDWRYTDGGPAEAAAVAAVPLWLAVTGLTKILVLALATHRPKEPPPAHPDTHGRARDATWTEAAEAMRGKGGRRSSLDDRRF